MKYLVILSMLSICFVSPAQAQTDATSEFATHAAFMEVGGPSFIYSLNYDFRFSKSHPDGWGMRAGIGGYSIGEDYAFAIPVLANYLKGKKGNYFEAAFGVIAGGGSSGVLLMDPDSFPLAGCVYVGFRAQPSDGGFVFMAGIPFIIGAKEDYNYETNSYTDHIFATPSWPGIALGFSFK